MNTNPAPAITIVYEDHEALVQHLIVNPIRAVNLNPEDYNIKAFADDSTEYTQSSTLTGYFALTNFLEMNLEEIKAALNNYRLFKTASDLKVGDDFSFPANLRRYKVLARTNEYTIDGSKCVCDSDTPVRYGKDRNQRVEL